MPQKLQEWQWADLFIEQGYERLISALKLRAKALGKLVIPQTDGGSCIGKANLPAASRGTHHINPEIVDQFEGIRSTILHIRIVNNLFPALHMLRVFFDQHPALFRIELNEAFYNKWLTHPLVERNLAATSSFWTQKSVEELHSELGKLHCQ